MVIPLSIRPKGLFAATALCMAIAGITASWAEDEISEVDFPEQLAAEPETAQTVLEATPATYLFSSGSIENTANGPALQLKVPGGVPGSIDGLTQAVTGYDGTVTLSLDSNHGEGYIETKNHAGAYGRLYVRRLKVTLDEFDQGPMPDSTSDVFQDDIYISFKALVNAITIKKDMRARDALLQAGKSLVIHRANGDLVIELYRQTDNDQIEYLGSILADSKLRHEFHPSQDCQEFYEQRDASKC